MKILFWPAVGSWATSFVQGRHEYVVPVAPGPGGAAARKARPADLTEAITELAPAMLRDSGIDLVVLQHPDEIALAGELLGRVPGRDVPAVYVEHRPPATCVERHLLADQSSIPIVHVSAFNQLFWDNGAARTVVIEPGLIDPGPRYSGEIAHGGIAVDDLPGGGRALGADLVPRFIEAGPVDLFGTGSHTFAAGVDGPMSANDAPAASDETLWELARRRAFIHPARWTSIGSTLIEAMHMGMPVLALATTAVAEVVPPDAGTVSNNVDHLVRSFATMLKEPEIARYMGQQARKAALRRFGLARFLGDWDELLGSLP